MSDNQFIQKKFDGISATEFLKEYRSDPDNEREFQEAKKRLERDDYPRTVIQKLPDTPHTYTPKHATLEKGQADRIASDAYATAQESLLTNPVQYIHVISDYTWYLGDSTIGQDDIVILRCHNGEGIERFAYRLYCAWLKAA